MPDITANRPSSGASIESAWGGQVHDMLEGIQAGVANVVWSGSADSAGTVVTFPRAYTAAPTVIVALHTGITRAIVAKPLAGSITTTGFTIRGEATSGVAQTGTVPCSWIAIGTPA